jgi:hypothetical protein
MGILTLLVALSISGIAAWYSIVGLMAIFAAAKIPIAIMGAVLEVGKLVTASWLYQNWRTSPKLLRAYLTASVIVIMFITSMGIFGFLSKAHIDQKLVGGDNSLLVTSLDQQIQSEQRRVDDAQRVIKQLDVAVETLLRYDRVRGKDGAIEVRKSQTAERDALSKITDEAVEKISSLRAKKQKLESEQLKFEAEIGPIKYIAELFVKDSRGYIDSAVRGVILTIIFVFDPLAVLLVLAANISLRRPKRIEKVVKVVKNEWVEDVAEMAVEPVVETKVEPETPMPVAMTREELRRQQNEAAVKKNGTFGPTEKA